MQAVAVNGSAETPAKQTSDASIGIQGGDTLEVPAEDDDPFTLLASLAATTLLQSDRKRDGKKEAGGKASSATNWVDEGSAFNFRGALDKVELYNPTDMERSTGTNMQRQDEAITWLRWMKSIPSPIVVDLSAEGRDAANSTVSDDFLRLLSTDQGDDGVGMSASRLRQLREEFLDRLECRLVLLPSGQGLVGGLHEPSGSLVFGKLLYGGVTRYRILPSSSGSGGADQQRRPPRRAGERTERKTRKSQNIPSWVQYGGSCRLYEGVDMGAAAVLEFSLLPKIQGGFDEGDSTMNTDMVLERLGWHPRNMFRFVDGSGGDASKTDDQPMDSDDYLPKDTLQGQDRNEAFASEFRRTVGGLGPQIDSIVRRVLDGRVIRPAEVDGRGNMMSYKEAREAFGGQGPDDSALDGASRQLSLASLEAEELELLGLTPVRGLLLYGPPGCGKTALAREISRALKARAPKIVAAPELLDRWVGGSEKLVRELFADAEAELASVNGDARKSALHVIVIDEIDAVFRQRSSADDSGEATRSSTVNQILSKLDGVEAIPNVLLIGLTNRRELLDDALLRPGRLEVQIEIPLPDKEGRREILSIHFGALRKRGRLSLPLCQALDGTISSEQSGASSTGQPKGKKRRALKKALRLGRSFDLADDSVTGGFSGASLEGLVRCAGSLALARARKQGLGVESLQITLDDVKDALVEVQI